MSGPVGKAELDAMGCDTPGCDHDHSVLYLHQECHPTAGLEARYVKADGVVAFNCAECNASVGAVYVGEAPEAPPTQAMN